MAIKQRRLAPGRDYSAAQGVLVEAGEAITAGDIVYASSVDGGLMVVSLADATDVTKSQGKLFVAKHAIRSGERGIVLPWQLVTADTSLLLAGAPIYLKTGGDYGGSLAASSAIQRVVGTVVTSDTAGKILLDLGMDSGPGISAVETADIPISLMTFREVDATGDVGAAAANGGVLASDTTPILRAETIESQTIFWAAGDTDQIATHISLPRDVDGANPVIIDIWAEKTGTNAACTFTVETSWDNTNAIISDTSSSLLAANEDQTRIQATVAAADIPDSPSNVSISLIPSKNAGDAVQIYGVRLTYTKKLPANVSA
jgi:hypothetical protein